ncbi:MAG: hypothetical protein ABI678_06395 [Kofleriaceae bacterium]
MKVRFKRGWGRTFGTLTPGNVYRVIGIEAGMLRIIDDSGEPILFAPQAFDTIEAAEPADWISNRGDEGERYAYPQGFGRSGFFEDWHDRDQGARSKLSAYVRGLCWRDAETADHANTYLRVEWKHTHADDPVVLYVELDEDRWEVRKVEVFADGRTTYADGRGSSGDTRLGEFQTPPVDEIAKDPEFTPVAISSEEFETLWEKAADADVGPA